MQFGAIVGEAEVVGSDRLGFDAVRGGFIEPGAEGIGVGVEVDLLQFVPGGGGVDGAAIVEELAEARGELGFGIEQGFQKDSVFFHAVDDSGFGGWSGRRVTSWPQ